MLSRRRFISRAVGGAVGVSLGAAGLRARVARAQSVDGTVELGDGFYVLGTGETNVLAVTAGDGVALVDGGSASESADLLRRVAELPGGERVHTLFNTHWHPEQTGSNEALGRAGARIVAQVNTRLWLTTDVTWPWNEQTVEPLPEAALPNETFYDEAEISVGEMRVRCGHLKDCPHTDGDIYVFFRKANVLVAGDVVAVGRFPLVDPDSNGWIGGIATAAGTLAGLADERTQVIPGLGAPQKLAHVKAEAAMLETLRQRLAQLLAQGLSASEMVEKKPAAEFEAEWGDPTQLIRNAYPGLAHRARELGVSIV